MIVFLLLLVLGIILAAVAVASIVYIAGILLMILTVFCLVDWVRKQKLEPTPMVCTRCGSPHVMIQARPAGSVGFFSGGLFTSSIVHERVIVCQQCGFDSPYLGPEDVARMQESAKNWLIGSVVFLVLDGVFAFLLLG